MPNVNCLQYATRGNDQTTIPANTFGTAVWWNNYIANPVNQQTSQTWSTLALAVKRLVLATTGWKVPKTTGPVVSKGDLRTSGIDLLRHLAGNNALNWTKQSGTAGAIPDTDGVIVMGEFSNQGGVHYFARVEGAWMGVPGPNDTLARAVTVTGNSSFVQDITGGTRNGTISGWFS